MKHLRRIFAAVVALAGTMQALATAPAAFAEPLPPSDCCAPGATTGSVTLITGGGMPGWQITLIALAAALVAATAAVVLDRTRTSRRSASATG